RMVDRALQRRGRGLHRHRPWPHRQLHPGQASAFRCTRSFHHRAHARNQAKARSQAHAGSQAQQAGRLEVAAAQEEAMTPTPRSRATPAPARDASSPSPLAPRELRDLVTTWYHQNARDLPWRSPDVSAWGILVSEIMLQQTPVVRVLPRWQDWMARWPTPADLAAADTAEVLRAWDRLGYPRRALRLHQAAGAITEKYDGVVPTTEQELRELPGIGSYTAAAVASFAHRRAAV